jgi:hypothetical protein
MKLKTWILSEGAHFRITIGLALILLTAVAGFAIWKTNVENDIQINTRNISDTEARNLSAHFEMMQMIKDNASDIQEMKEAITRTDTNVQWIRDDMEKR